MSLFIHLLLGGLTELFPVVAPRQNQTVQIEILKSPTKVSQDKTKQMIRETLVPDDQKVAENDDPLKFWSKQTLRVKKQMRASQVGLTQNRANTTATELQKKPVTETQKTRRSAPSDLERELASGDLLVQARREVDSNRPRLQEQSSGVSTIGESLPEDVKVGSFTALNTDRYLFYSFYARAEELIRYRWENMVTETLRSTSREKLEANVRSRWTSQVEVLLNQHGDVHKVMLMKESGIPGFDRSAVQAFLQAAYFPNPHKEMVEDDGFIHLRYSFTVYFDPRTMARP